jgi:hypothetical protein
VVIQRSHYMYSTVTQRALQELLRPIGIRYSSLSSPLHNSQVQQLLWRRYPDISDLQYSCWQVGPNEATCSKCTQCFRLALCALFIGGNPGRMGIDLTRLLLAMRDWKPRSFPAKPHDSLLPDEILRPENDCQIIQYIHRVPLRRVFHLLAGRRPKCEIPARTRDALKAYAQLRRRVADFPAGEPLGYRPAFMRQVDPVMRPHVAEIFARHFRAEPESAYAGVLQRGDTLANWICQPLIHAARN